MNLRRSIVISASAKYAATGLGFISSVILARLLTPEDFGIYSIAASIALVGYLFRNFGVNQFIIQVETLNDEILRTAFSITLAISWTIAGLLAASSGWVGDFYGNPGIALVLLFLSLNFVLLPFGSVADSVLRRNLEFGKLAVINVASAFTGMSVAIISAWFGAEYLSIVWASNAATLVTIALNLYYRPPGLPWRPGLGALHEVSGFGLKVGLLDLVTNGGDSVTELIIGKSHGLHNLGMYSRAYGAFNLFEHAFIEGIRPVVLPFLSEAKRNRAALAPMYLQIVSFVSIFMAPFFVFLLISGMDVIRVLYGDQWDDAVPVLQVMCFAGLLLVPTIYFEQLLIAHSRPGLALRYQLAFQGSRIVVLLVLAGGELWLAALALVAGTAVKVLMTVRLAQRIFALQLTELLKTLTPSAIASISLGAVLWLATSAMSDWEAALPRLLLSAVLAGLVWLAAVFATRHPAADEIRKIVRRLKPA